MAGLIPGRLYEKKVVDARHKPGHDAPLSAQSATAIC
jgi:hypothetical protein